MYSIAKVDLKCPESIITSLSFLNMPFVIKKKPQ